MSTPTPTPRTLPSEKSMLTPYVSEINDGEYTLDLGPARTAKLWAKIDAQTIELSDMQARAEAAEALVVEQREQLITCFKYLGQEIERLPLNESSVTGVQQLSLSVATVLDKSPAETRSVIAGLREDKERIISEWSRFNSDLSSDSTKLLSIEGHNRLQSAISLSRKAQP